RLFTQYPWHALVPDQEGVLVTHGSGDGNRRIQGAYSADGRYALVYLPEEMPVWVDLARLTGAAVDAWWFDPVSGEYSFVRRYQQKQVTAFQWERNPDGRDHVLVLSSV
ncbi:MAG: putative collagen-binding domain-containing protein, partial [Armatimonadota bacterium]|nr:putative collagen-binding domain-containing protein [Armatimonadota bacterium]